MLVIEISLGTKPPAWSDML